MKQPHKKQGGGWQRRMRQKAAENPLLLKPKGFARPPLVKGGIQFHSFREALGESRMASFLAHIRREKRVDACAYLDEVPGKGRNLLDLVLTGEPCGYSFGFRKFARNRWSLFLGCAAGALAGDFGVW